INARTELVLLRHAKETWRTSNTGRISALALERCEVLEVGAKGADRDAFELRIAELLEATGRIYLLYPGPGVEPPRFESAGDRLRLSGPEGFGHQVRRLLRRGRGWANLPRLSFPGEHALRLRRPPNPDGMSTIEAIARALGAIEGEVIEQQLSLLY